MKFASARQCSCVYCLVSPTGADTERCSYAASVADGTADQAVVAGSKRRRRVSFDSDAKDSDDEEERPLDLSSVERCYGAWDFPLSRDEKVRRLLQLLEAENRACAVAASTADERRSKAAARTKELETEISSLRSYVTQLEGQVHKRKRQASGASTSEDDCTSEGEDSLRQRSLPPCTESLPAKHSDEECSSGSDESFEQSSLPPCDSLPVSEDEASQERGDVEREKRHAHAIAQEYDAEDSDCESEVPPPPMAFGIPGEGDADFGSRSSGSENLLAQLLLSVPSLPMLPKGSSGEAVPALPLHLSSMVTPRCQPSAVSSASRNLGTPRAPLGKGCLNLGGIQSATPRGGPCGRGTPRAPLGVGRLNLDHLSCLDVTTRTPTVGTARPADRNPPSWEDRRLCSARLANQLDVGIATPRVVSVANGVSGAARLSVQATHLGTVSAVRWRGVEAVEFLEFVLTGGDSQTSLSNSAPSGGPDAPSVSIPARAPAAESGGDFKLQTGESIQVLRGCVDVTDGRMADWVVLVTSKLRSKRFGKLAESGQANPTFSFIARPGFEICGVATAADGSIEGVTQRAL